MFYLIMTNAIRVSKTKSGVGNQCAAKIINRQQLSQRKFHQNDRLTKTAATGKEPLEQPTSPRIRHPERSNHARPPWQRKPPFPVHPKRPREEQRKRPGKGRNKGNNPDGIQSHQSTRRSPRESRTEYLARFYRDPTMTAEDYYRDSG